MRTNAINYLLSFEIAVKNLELVKREYPQYLKRKIARRMHYSSL